MMGERPPRRPGIEREEVVITRGDPRRDDETIPPGSKLVTWRDLDAWQRAMREEIRGTNARLDQLIADSQDTREYRREREDRERRRDQSDRTERDSDRVRIANQAVKEAIAELVQIEDIRTNRAKLREHANDAKNERRTKWVSVVMPFLLAISGLLGAAVTSHCQKSRAEEQTNSAPIR